MRTSLKGARKGLEPLIAAIILIAITLVIAIAVAAWLLGVFGTSVTGSEQLSIYPNGTLKSQQSGGPSIQLWILNKGTSASTIVGIVVGNGSCTASVSITIQPGQVGKVGDTNGQPLSGPNCASYIVAGITYQVRVQTAAGNVFFTTVTAS